MILNKSCIIEKLVIKVLIKVLLMLRDIYINQFFFIIIPNLSELNKKSFEYFIKKFFKNF